MSRSKSFVCVMSLGFKVIQKLACYTSFPKQALSHSVTIYTQSLWGACTNTVVITFQKRSQHCLVYIQEPPIKCQAKCQYTNTTRCVTLTPSLSCISLLFGTRHHAQTAFCTVLQKCFCCRANINELNNVSGSYNHWFEPGVERTIN